MLSNAVECVPAPVQQKLVTYYSTSTIALHRSFPICSTPACFISLDRGQLQVNAGRSGLVPPRLFQTNAVICQRRILTVLRLKRATRQTRVFYRAYTLTCSCTSWLLSLHHQPSSTCCLARILQEPASEASTLPAANHSLQHQLGAGKASDCTFMDPFNTKMQTARKIGPNKSASVISRLATHLADVRSPTTAIIPLTRFKRPRQNHEPA